MKKTLLTLTLTIVTIFASAQCIPDPQYVGGGIYPDTITGVADAYVGQPYDQLMTIITPSDTDLVISGISLNATIDNIDLTNVIGLPPNFTYDCNPTSCSFPGGSTDCANIYSTINPTISDIGLYPVTFECIAYVTIPLLGGTTQTFITGGYEIEIVGNTTSVIHQFNNQKFELKSPFPHPVNDQSKIQFITGEAKDIVFFVFNYLGEKMDEQIIAANRGVNDIFINANNYPNGMYLYSINNGETIISKRMMIAN